MDASMSNSPWDARCIKAFPVTATLVMDAKSYTHSGVTGRVPSKVPKDLSRTIWPWCATTTRAPGNASSSKATFNRLSTWSEGVCQNPSRPSTGLPNRW